MPTCNQCHQAFQRTSSLNRHTRCKHLEPRPVYRCAICSRECCREDVLRRHEQMHRGEGSSKCQYCARHFRNDYLVGHQAICRMRPDYNETERHSSEQSFEPSSESQTAYTPHDRKLLSSGTTLSRNRFSHAEYSQPSDPSSASGQFGGPDDSPSPQETRTGMFGPATRMLDNSSETKLNPEHASSTPDNIHTTQEDGWPVVTHAVCHTVMHVVRRLIPRGANSSVTSGTSRTRCPFKRIYNHFNGLNGFAMPSNFFPEPTIGISQSASSDDKSLLDVARARSRPVVIHCLEAALNIERQGCAEGITPLELACRYDNAEAVQILIELDADVDAGLEPPLQRAIKSSSVQVVQILLQAGAHIDLVSSDCRNELEFESCGVSLSFDPQDIYPDAREKLDLLQQHRRISCSSNEAESHFQ